MQNESHKTKARPVSRRSQGSETRIPTSHASATRWISRAALLRRLEDCEAFHTPPAFVSLLSVNADSAVDPEEISELLENAPTVRRVLLQWASSPVFGQGRSARNVRQAFDRLGTHGVLSLAAVIAMIEWSPRIAPGVIDPRRHWARGIAGAVAARLLLLQRDPQRADLGFVLAAAQDIGMLALAHATPELYAALGHEALSNRAFLREAETEWLGAHHGEVSTWLLDRWCFPKDLVERIAAGWAAASTEEESSLATFVAGLSVASLMADTWGGIDSVASARRAASLAGKALSMPPATLRQVLNQVSVAVPALQGAMADATPNGGRDETDEVAAALLVPPFHAAGPRIIDAARPSPCIDALPVLRREFATAARHGWPLSIACIRVSGWRSPEDGEDSPVSDLLRSLVRCGDTIAPCGTNHHLLLMPGEDGAAARAASTRIIELLQAGYPNDNALSCAAGIAVLDGERRFPSAADLFSAAAHAERDASARPRLSPVVSV